MILPVSAQRFCCRNRVERGGAHGGRLKRMQEVTDRGGTANFGLLRDPSFLGAGMAAVMYSLEN